MIEFKAECGHTVRAKDEDAGNVVRCSYCGRNAAVPETRGDGLDFLFDEVQPAISGRAIPRRRGWGLFRRRRSKGPFDPFAVIVRMCYAAGLIIIVVVVARKFVMPLFEEGGFVDRRMTRATAKPTPPEQRTRKRGPRVERRGLINLNPVGLYVGSTPSNASVFVADAAHAPVQGRIQSASGCLRTKASGDPLKVADGTYVVEVVLPWNDPRLNDMNLPYYAQYRAFRRAIEVASREERIRLVEDYFVPDEAASAFIHETDEQIYIVRQYRDVVVRDGKAKGVRALFLPKLQASGKSGFSIAQLVMHAIPDQPAYAFSENHVKTELDYYRVPQEDWEFAIEALKRIGIIPYVTPDGRTRLFKIGIHDGVFASKIVREAER